MLNRDWAAGVVGALALLGCQRAATTTPTTPQAPLPAHEGPLAAPVVPSGPTPAPVPIDPAIVERVFESTPSVADDGVVKVTWPRTEVPVRIDGMAFPPAAGLTSWAAFAAGHDGAMVMGDTVVFEDEVDAAMDAAFAHGLAVTALHNHFFFDQPKVYFMHIGGHGAPEALALSVHATWQAIAAVRSATPKPATGFTGPAPSAGALDAAAIEAAIGVPPKAASDVLKVVIGREASMHGTGFGATMGLTTWAAFTGSDAHAAMDGDIAMTAAEVPAVLRTLRASGIHVVALHNHMIGESPAYYFTHFWAKGPAAQLAAGFRAALDAQKRVQASASP